MFCSSVPYQSARGRDEHAPCIRLTLAGSLITNRGGRHSPPECQRQRRARTLSPPAPRIVEKPQACSISRMNFMAAPMQRQSTCRLLDHCGGRHLPPECQRQRRARTLSLSPSRTVEQPHVCSISRRSFTTTSLQRQTTCRLLDRRGGKHSPPECQRQRRARTLRPPSPPRTVEQPQAC